MRLRAIEPEELPQLRDWRNQLMENFRQWRPLNMLNQYQWLYSVTFGDKNIMFAVDIGRIAGVTGLTYIDWLNRNAECSIYIAPEFAGKGLGQEALQLVCDYGFRNLALRRLYAEIFAFNQASINLFESVGFQREGVLRSNHYHDGKWVDCAIYGVLDEEWR